MGWGINQWMILLIVTTTFCLPVSAQTDSSSSTERGNPVTPSLRVADNIVLDFRPRGIPSTASRTSGENDSPSEASPNAARPYQPSSSSATTSVSPNATGASTPQETNSSENLARRFTEGWRNAGPRNAVGGGALKKNEPYWQAVRARSGYPRLAQNTSSWSSPNSSQYSPAPSSSAPPGGGYAPGSVGTAPPGAYPPGSTPPYAPQGGVGPSTNPGLTPASPSFDPYAVPGSQGLFPQQPVTPSPSSSAPFSFSHSVQEAQRFLDTVGVDYLWMPGTASDELGINEFDFRAQFAIPFSWLPEGSPLFVAPGFGFHLWNGPEGPPVHKRHFPAKTFDAYIDAGMEPQFNQTFGAETWARIGVFSDFEEVTTESIRIQGRGMLSVVMTPAVTAKLGVIYLDRARIKLLPSGGIVWQPNDDIIWHIIFPDPKLSKRLVTVNTTDWWGYVGGDYGGGSWSIAYQNEVLRTDYNDFRVGVGLEFDNQNSIDGAFEVGLAFQRELYADGEAWAEPNTTVYLRSMFAY
jgi:hypothetical protein